MQLPPHPVSPDDTSSTQPASRVDAAIADRAAALDMNALRHFLVLMDEGSVSKAAQRVGISQPAMSRSLTRLREVFGDPLLVTGHGRMIATVRAEALQPEIARLVANLAALVATGESFEPASAARTIVVSSSEMFESLLMPGLVARLQQEAPQVRVHFEKPDRTRIEGWLADGRVDFRLAFLPDWDGGLHMRRLFEDHWVVLARRDHPQVRNTLSMEAYASLPHAAVDIVGLTTSEQMIDQALARHGLARRIQVRVQSALTLPGTVAVSDVVTTLPRQFVRAFGRDDLQLLEPPVKLSPMVCGLYWHERTHRSEAHRWFRNLLAEVAAAIIPA